MNSNQTDKMIDDLADIFDQVATQASHKTQAALLIVKKLSDAGYTIAHTKRTKRPEPSFSSQE